MSESAMKTWFESRRGELVALVGELVAAKTVNPPGDEWRAAEVVERYLAGAGIASGRHEKEPGRTNIVARVGRGLPRLLVVGHLDTVPAGDGWATDPFTLVEKDSKLFGRGTVDDKGATAAMLLAGKYLQSRERDLTGEVILVGAADEERGSRLGMCWLLDEKIVEADLAIIPDAANDMRKVYVAEKAALFYRITSFGKQAHGSTPEKGINAITNLMEVVRRLGAMRFDVTSHRLLTPPTFNVGMIEGGVAPNVVPAMCTADLDMRFLPGDSGERIVAKIEQICRDVEREIPGARFELAVRQMDTPIELPESHPLVEAVVHETEAVLGRAPVPAGVSGSTVAKSCMAHGIPAVNFAPGDGGLAHMADECVDVDSLVNFAHVLTRILLRLMR